MEKKKIDRVIEAFRNYINLKEEGMVANASGTQGGFGGSSTSGGPSAGYDKPLDGRSKMMRRLPPAYRKSLSKNKK